MNKRIKKLIKDFTAKAKEDKRFSRFIGKVERKRKQLK